MKRKLHFWLLSLPFFILSISGKGQCPPGDLHFTTQEQIDNFRINYPNCNQFPGTITVEGSNITSLNGFSNLTKINGNLRIWHTTQLLNLEGLESLAEIGGDLNLYSNHNIQNTEGLNNLTKIGAHFDFYINPSLKDVNALSNLTQIGGFLQLSESPQITSITGLRNIDPCTITGSGLHLVNNSSLAVCNLPNLCTYLQGPGPRNISGNAGNCISAQAMSNACAVSCPSGNLTLASQAEVNSFGVTYAHCSNIFLENLTISGNSIVNLNGLSNLTSIEGQLKIQNNPQLMNLNGLTRLTNIADGLHISGNSTLNDISILQEINLETLGEFIITNNSSLSVCNLPNLCEYLSDVNNPRTISGNAGSCFDEAAVLLACFPCEAPENLGVENLSANSADLVWESEEASFDIQWGTSGFNLGNGTVLTGIHGNSHQLTGLSPNTQYEFYVRTDCGITKSDWAGPFAFTTLYPCPSGDFTFTSQQQLNNFGIMYGHCTNITLGNVAIRNSNITDLSPLSNVTYVTGRLFISDNPQLIYLEGLNNLTQVGRLVIQSNSSLTNLDELENLTQIGELFININASLSSLNGLNNLTQVGRLVIQSNNSLTNLSGLNNLTQVEERLAIQMNNSLTNLDGLENLTQIEGELFISINASLSSLNGLNNLTQVGTLTIKSNNSLTNLDGLNNLEYVVGSLQLYNNYSLSDLSGLSNLTQIGGYLSINNNDLLTNLDGLSNLTEIGGLLEIYNNGSLTNLNGLSSLTQIGEGLSISGNYQLNDISGLQNIDPSTIGGLNGLRIINNPSLSVCNLPNFCTYLQGPGPRTISGNAGDCITEQAVLDACQPCEAPSGLNVDNLTNNSADLTWESEGELFDIQWGTAGFELENGTIVGGIEETTYHLSDLIANTQYEFYVRTDCGLTKSDWVGPYAFTLPVYCTLGNITLSTQQELNNFGSTYAYCTNITVENLTIGKINGIGQNTTTDIVDLTPLHKLTEVTSDLILSANRNLTSLNGLNSLESVGENLHFTNNNRSLTNLDDLNSLQNIGGNLIIEENWTNSALSNVNGLNNLTHIEGNIILRNNNSLVNIDGLSNLTQIEGELYMFRNSSLSHLNGLNNLTQVGGRLIINSNDSLTNLSGLENLTQVGGDFFISNNISLTNLSGLNNLTQVEERLVIQMNNSLTNLDGLENLTQIVGNLSINNNDSLTNLESLSNLTQIGGGLTINYNSSLTNLNGLSNLTQIGGLLEIYNNGSLTNLNGLSNLSQIGGDLSLNHSSLSNLDGLSNLTQIGGYLSINNNDLLTNLDGFNNLTQIGGDLIIAYNSQLSDISGLQNIDPSTIGGLNGLRIMNNPSLSVCNLPNFCTYLQGPGPRTIYGNAGDCITEQAVLDVCEQSGNCNTYTIWDGLAWSNGAPGLDKKAIIDGTFVMDSDLEACELEVTADGSLEIPAGFSFTVNGMVSNFAAAESFVVASDGNLIQIEDIENSGEITVIRESQPMIRLDYTLWSSPVVAQNLFGFSPLTVNGVTNHVGSAGRIYIYDGDNAYVNPDPFTAEAVMENGVGYLFRSPNNYSSTVPEIYVGVFTGVANNGNIQVTAHAGNYNSIGNPYPSNITLIDLYAANPAINAVYFWNNNHSAGNNYATCTNGMGCVAASGGGNTPNGVITAGQGFIVHTDASSVSFDNSMRVNHSGIFFRVDELESHRFRLNLDGQDESYNQILVGYVSEATNEIDAQIDGKMFGYEGSALFNIIDEEPFVIQGRALPFEVSDVVQLGFRAAEGGKFRISLVDFDGVFAEGNTTIYLKDNQLGIIHNLMGSEYEFESTQGIFKERFEVIYETEAAMGTGDFDSNLVQIYQNENQIMVSSETEKILSVELFDMNGRNLHRNAKVNANHYQIGSKAFGTQVLLVKVQTANREVVTKKLVNK